MKEYLEDILVVSLGLILAFSFFKPWLPGYMYWFSLTANEPVLAIRITEGIVGLGILGFGIERVVATLRGK